MNSKKNIWNIVFMAIVCIQIALIVIFNLTHLTRVAGFDSSAAMSQAMEIWKQKTIFLKDWSYQSTLGLDSMLLVASLLYGITGNIFLAYGIADCIAILLYIYIVGDIIKRIGGTRLTVLIGYMMLLTPYTLEPLGYMPMMFTNASYYTIKVLIPLMLIDIMLRLRAGKMLKEMIPLLLLYGVSLYFTGFSCGMYLLICGLLPVIFYELLMVVLSGQIKNVISTRSAVLLGSLVIYALGYISVKIYGAEIFTNDMILCRVENFVDNFFSCFVGIAELFGAIPYRKISVISMYGINYLSHMGAFVLYIIFFVVTIKKVKPFNVKKNTQTDLKKSAVGMICSVIIINLLVLILTDTTYGSDTFEFRYHLIPVVAGMVVVAIGITDVIEHVSINGNGLMANSILAIVAGIWILSNAVFAYYFCLNGNSDVSERVVNNIVKNCDSERVYYVGSDADLLEIARIAKLTNDDLVITEGLGWGDYLGWGESMKDNLSLDCIDNMTMVCTQDSYDELPQEVKDKMHFITDVDRYKIYVYSITF